MRGVKTLVGKYHEKCQEKCRTGDNKKNDKTEKRLENRGLGDKQESITANNIVNEYDKVKFSTSLIITNYTNYRRW